MKRIPRGLRNNNPLNIERSRDNWRGLASEQKDSRFFTFVAPEFGYRAALIILRNYQRKYGLVTLEQMISRWAPSHENNTMAYVDTVARRAGIKTRKAVNLNDKDTAIRLLEAMSYVENGMPGNVVDIAKGVDMVL